MEEINLSVALVCITSLISLTADAFRVLAVFFSQKLVGQKKRSHKNECNERDTHRNQGERNEKK